MVKINNFNTIYRGKNILITGHTGFKGSWLTIWLTMLGANVIGYSLDPCNQYDNFNMCGLKDKVIDIRGDIRNLEELDCVFEKYKPEFVFHLAAQPLVRMSYEYPKETYDINVMGTLNVLECIKNSNSVKVAVMVTTDKCYENREQIWGYRETDPLGGYDPYSSSKACAEILISSYRNSYMKLNSYLKHGKAIASVRAGNVIGGGDWSLNRIVPDCVKAIMDNNEIVVRNPSAVRPWQFVLEPLSGYLLLASKLYSEGPKYASAWNFGPNENMNIEVKDIVEKIIKVYGKGNWVDDSAANNLHEANLLTLDCAKSRAYLKWKPVLNFDETIEMTVEWYKNFQNENMYNFCSGQINSYIQRELDRNYLGLGSEKLI